jgi:hypothetical protein
MCSIRTLSLVIAFSTFATAVSAQVTDSVLLKTEPLVATELSALTNLKWSKAIGQSSQPRRDSLWNGALAGAGIGAILGALGGLAISDCNECSGFNVPLTFGVLGAAAGAGLGAGFDALRSQGLRAGVSSHRVRRMALSPVVRGHRRAVVGHIRF